MKIVQSLVLCAAAVLTSSGLALAQSSGGPSMGPPSSGAGSSSGGASGAPGSIQPDDLDLPLAPATLQVPVTPPGPPEDTPIGDEPPEGDEPSDTPPPTLYGEELDTENDTIIYVLDISCSMGWDSQSYTTMDGRTRRGERIDRAKAELGRSIMGLSDNFKFNIIAFDCGMRTWQRSLRPADDGNKNSAISWVMALRPTGATGTGPATAAALADKENMSVVLLTDGAPNCGASGSSGHRRMISSANTQGAIVNVFGIAASGSYRSFCQSVASDAGGTYFDVP